MESLAEAPEHDEGLWGEEASRNSAVGALIAPCWALTAEASARKLVAGPSVPTNPRHASTLPPIELTSVTWERDRKRFQCW